MVGTVSFCFICILALVVLSQAAKQENRFLLFLGIAILSLTSGLRAYDVGIDTPSYYDAFVSDFAIHPWEFDEEGFRALVRALMALFGNPTVVYLVIAIATNLLVILRLWDFRNNASFAYMSFFYIAVFYIGTMNTMRQYLAVAIVFFATRFLERKKYLSFIVSLLVATSIHTTALMGVVYLFVYLWENTPKEKRIYLGIAAVALIPPALAFVVSYESDHIENYFSNNVDNLNATYLYRIAIFLIAILLVWLSDGNARKHDEELAPRRSENAVPLFAFMGLVASSAGMFFRFLGRLGYYFSMFEMVFWGQAVKRERWGWLLWLMPTAYAIYTFGYEIAFNGSGIFPFHFYFN